mgnify:CR=1 FL=1
MKKNLNQRLISSLIIIPLSFFFIIKGSYLFNFFLLFCISICFYEWHFISKSKIYHSLGFFFLIFSFYSAYELRNSFGKESLIIFLFVILVCVLSDIGGYIFGNIFKGPKLTKISPKKTYSGVFGGFLLSLIAGLIFTNYFFVDRKIFNEDLFLLTVILFISMISQIGDLIISYFKRKAKLKDTGKIIPGHGGLLDRIDGMIFVFPIFYLISIL